jgi:threonine dehydrogenase-like Zn-dependent dehydrogenase
MVAMIYRGPLRVGIDHEPPIPKIPHPRDTIVQITRSRICESELHPYNGDVPDIRVGITS